MKNIRAASTGVFRQETRETRIWKIIVTFLFVLIISTEIGLCTETASSYAYCRTQQCLETARNLLEDMNRTIDPCDNFYDFACGKWHENLSSRYNATDWFFWSQTVTYASIFQVLRSTDSASEPKSVKKMRTMYNACIHMDTDNGSSGLRRLLTAYEFSIRLPEIITEEQTITKIAEYLRKLDFPYVPNEILAENATVTATDSTADTLEWVDSIAKIKKITDLDEIFGFNISPDPINQTRHHVSIGMQRVKLFESLEEVPYSNEPEENEPEENLETEASLWAEGLISLISKFVKYYDLKEVKNQTEIRKLAEKSVEFAIAINRLINEMNENENLTRVYLHLKDFQELTNKLIAPKAPDIWRKYLNEIFKDIQPSIDLDKITIMTYQSDSDYLPNLMKLISNTPNDVLNFCIWCDLVQDLWELYENEESMKNLDEKNHSVECMLKTVVSMPMAAAYAIIEPNFCEDKKPKIEAMVNNIRQAFTNSIERLNWIDNKTAELILEKANAMKMMVGLPDGALDADKLDDFYAELSFSETSHFDNLMHFQQWKINRKLKTLHLVDDIDWIRNPTTVNAYYWRKFNKIILPFAILRYPFYDLGIDALNYGSMGWLIGHELLHGFDNEGRKFDKNGEQVNRWTNETISEFERRSKCFVDQYHNYHVSQVNQTMNGTSTMPENIADNGGIRLAYSAYKLQLNSNEIEKQLLPGFENFTIDQLFFISFAHSQCETETIQNLQKLLKSVHAPARFRVNGPLANFDEFHKAFNCRPGSKMVSENQCRIW